jgi:hypothetical protein
MSRFGVDISEWDGRLDPQRLMDAGVEFVIIRCGYADKGLGRDSLFDSNYDRFRAAGIPVGVYWYSVASDEEEAAREAECCLSILSGRQLDYPVWMDVETRKQQQMSVNQPGQLGRTIDAFCARIRQGGYRAGVYSWKWLLEPSGALTRAYDWWVCAWTTQRPSCKCEMWQFGGETNEIRSTHVAGYGPMDQDYCYAEYGRGGVAMLSIPERIAQVAEHFAAHDAHGYSQPNRGVGGNETIYFSDGTHATISDSDVDCSEMVRQCLNAAFDKEVIEYMWTGDEDEKLRAHGFTRTSFIYGGVRRGDILWVKGHTGVALGGGKQADAHGDEYGGITGPNRGDNTGHEVEVRSLRSSWTYIYRYGDGGSQTDADGFDMTKTFVFPDGVNVRSEPRVSPDTYVTEYGPGESCTVDSIVFANGRVWGSYIGGSSGKRRYVALAAMDTARVA